jgi:hypothetical protein
VETLSKQKQAHVWERDGLDWYVEPASSTAALLREERFVGHIHDPSCGQGNIVRTLIDHGYHASGSDLVDRAGSPGWFRGKADFLGNEAIYAENIMMNPPFYKAKGAESFIRKALSVATGKVAVFVDIKFLAGGGRANGLYREKPPNRVWIITPRPSCPPGEVLKAGGKAEGGTADWVWLIWDMTAPASGTAINWLRSEA